MSRAYCRKFRRASMHTVFVPNCLRQGQGSHSIRLSSEKPTMPSLFHSMRTALSSNIHVARKRSALRSAITNRQDPSSTPEDTSGTPVALRL
jgi:hypothetical protein